MKQSPLLTYYTKHKHFRSRTSADLCVKASLVMAHLSGTLFKFGANSASLSAGVNLTQVPRAPATALVLSVG